MNIFGIGPGELLFIVIVTLLVVGPERLPILARKAGQALVTARNWIQRSPDAQMVLRMRQEMEQELETLRSSLTEVQKVRDEMINAAKQATKTLDDDVMSSIREVSDLAQPVPRATTRAAAINGQSQSILPPTEDQLDTAPTTSESLDAPKLSPEPSLPQPTLSTAQADDVTAPPRIVDGDEGVLVDPPPLSVGVRPPPPLAAPAPSLEQLNRRLDELTAQLASLQTALRTRGILDQPDDEPTRETNHVND